MPKLIKNGQLIDDAWQTLRLAEGDDPAGVNVPAGQWLVPLAVWQAQPALAARGDVAVWLAGDDEPAALTAGLATLALIAVNFPAFTDGRGYSIGALLPSRHGYRGDGSWESIKNRLRAKGSIIQYDPTGKGDAFADLVELKKVTPDLKKWLASGNLIVVGGGKKAD